MLSLANVSFAFGARPVVDGVTLTIERGTLVAIVGPNGAGKTTLLRLAAGLIAPTGGSIRLAGSDPATTSRRLLARQLAYLPQEYNLVFPFTVTEVVLMGRYPHHGPLALENEEDARLADQAMRRCDVADKAMRRFDALSGGERRRTLLAQAFCQAAELLLLDEPTASLDPAHAAAVFRILAEERNARQATALIVTHDLNLAVRLADRLILLDQGRVVADGPPADILSSPEAKQAFGVPLHVGHLPSGERFVVPA
jgi:iron complex transport system ATP-binding protein